jgi:Malectin domain
MFAVTIFCVLLAGFAACEPEVVFSVNAGDANATDSTGLLYAADTSAEGSVAGCTNTSTLVGVPLFDELLYRKERFENFSYNFSLTGDGFYRIVLKFIDCWHRQPGERIFYVLLNQRKVLEVDVIQRVGLRTALTENVLFSVCQGRVYFEGEEIELDDGATVAVDFVSVKNLAILNAMAVIKHERPDEDLPVSLKPTRKFFGAPKFQGCPQQEQEVEDVTETDITTTEASVIEVKADKRKHNYTINMNGWVVHYNFYGENAKFAKQEKK